MGPQARLGRGFSGQPIFRNRLFFRKPDFGSKMVEKKVEIEGAGLSRRDPARNSVSGGGVDVENGGMATHLVPNWGDLGSVGVPAPARTPLGPLGPKMGPHFPAKSAEILELSSIFGPPGILRRIQRIQRIQRKRDTASRTDPGFPTPGSRMTVVYTNSLKQA